MRTGAAVARGPDGEREREDGDRGQRHGDNMAHLAARGAVGIPAVEALVADGPAPLATGRERFHTFHDDDAGRAVALIQIAVAAPPVDALEHGAALTRDAPPHERRHGDRRGTAHRRVDGKARATGLGAAARGQPPCQQLVTSAPDSRELWRRERDSAAPGFCGSMAPSDSRGGAASGFSWP